MKKWMKGILLFSCFTILILTLAACGGTPSTSTAPSGGSTAPQQTGGATTTPGAALQSADLAVYVKGQAVYLPEEFLMDDERQAMAYVMSEYESDSWGGTPETSRGIRVGSTIAELVAAYPEAKTMYFGGGSPNGQQLAMADLLAKRSEMPEQIKITMSISMNPGRGELEISIEGDRVAGITMLYYPDKAGE